MVCDINFLSYSVPNYRISNYTLPNRKLKGAEHFKIFPFVMAESGVLSIITITRWAHEASDTFDIGYCAVRFDKGGAYGLNASLQYARTHQRCRTSR